MEVTVLLEYLYRVLYINEWNSIIRTFEHPEGPMSSDNRGTTVPPLPIVQNTSHSLTGVYSLGHDGSWVRGKMTENHVMASSF